MSALTTSSTWPEGPNAAPTDWTPPHPDAEGVRRPEVPALVLNPFGANAFRASRLQPVFDRVQRGA
jgi:hypothetical protein